MEKDEQFNSRIEQLIESNGGSINALALKAGIDQSSLNKVLKGKLNMSQKMVDAIAKACNVSPAWIKYGEGEKKLVERIEMKPHYLTLGQMGMLSEEQGADAEMLPVIPKLPKYDYTLEVRGDSMLPEYKSGDIVACLDVTKSSFIQWGRVHLLNTTQGVVMKVVHEEGDNIRCVSRNEEYPDIIIPKAEVYSIGLVVGMLRIV